METEVIQNTYSRNSELNLAIEEAISKLKHREPTFMENEDDRKKNPGLHMLHTKWAIEHLTTIDLAIEKMNAHSNLNMLEPVHSLMASRVKLVNQQAAYYDAQQFLSGIERARRLFKGETSDEIKKDPEVVRTRRSQMSEEETRIASYCKLNSRHVAGHTIVEVASSIPQVFVIDEEEVTENAE